MTKATSTTTMKNAEELGYVNGGRRGKVVHVEHQCSRCSHSNCIIFVAFVGCFRAVPFEIKSSLGRRNSCGNLHTTLPHQQKQVPKQQG